MWSGRSIVWSSSLSRAATVLKKILYKYVFHRVTETYKYDWSISREQNGNDGFRQCFRGWDSNSKVCLLYTYIFYSTDKKTEPVTHKHNSLHIDYPSHLPLLQPCYHFPLTLSVFPPFRRPILLSDIGRNNFRPMSMRLFQFHSSFFFIDDYIIFAGNLPFYQNIFYIWRFFYQHTLNE